MNSLYFDKMHIYICFIIKINHVWSRVKIHCFKKNTHCFPKNPIVFQHVHFFIPLFWNEKLSLVVQNVDMSSLRAPWQNGKYKNKHKETEQTHANIKTQQTWHEWGCRCGIYHYQTPPRVNLVCIHWSNLWLAPPHLYQQFLWVLSSYLISKIRCTKN